MTLRVLVVPDELVARLVSEPGRAEQVIGNPEALLDDDAIGEFNYGDLHELAAGRPGLTAALDQDGGTQVGDDFGYGPAWVFRASQLPPLTALLTSEASGADGPFRDFVALVSSASRTSHGLVLVCE